jgi:hypothetical protein
MICPARPLAVPPAVNPAAAPLPSRENLFLQNELNLARFEEAVQKCPKTRAKLHRPAPHQPAQKSIKDRI